MVMLGWLNNSAAGNKIWVLIDIRSTFSFKTHIVMMVYNLLGIPAGGYLLRFSPVF